MEIAGIVIALILVLIACIYFLLPTKKQEEEPKITEKITEKEESKPKKSEKQPRKHSRTIKNVQQDIEEHPMLETILHGKKKTFWINKGYLLHRQGNCIRCKFRTMCSHLQNSCIRKKHLRCNKFHY